MAVYTLAWSNFIISCCVFAGTAFLFAFFGQGTGPIFYDDLGCTGEENRLVECSHSGVGQHNCGHFEDASVRCTGEPTYT